MDRFLLILRRTTITIMVLTCVLIPVLAAWTASLTVPTFHIDGAFQTFSGLSRLANGDMPGRDFFPYLGAGPVLLLFPLFLLAGETLSASMFAATLAALVSVQIVFATTALLILKRRTWTVAITAATVPMAALAAIHAAPWIAGVDLQPFGFDALLALSLPGNSLRPLRSLAPYFLALTAIAAVLAGHKWGHRGRWLDFGLGSATGIIAAVWSNDYGYVSAGLLLLSVTVFAFLRPRWSLSRIVRLWLVSAASFIIVGFTITAGGFLNLLQYNLRDVRGDQFWYFPPWDTQSRIYSVWDFIVVLATSYSMFPLVILIGLGGWALLTRDSQRGLIAYVGLSLFAGGTIATVGGHIDDYYTPFRLWGLAVSLAATYLFLTKQIIPRLSHRTGTQQRTLLRATATVTVTTIAATGILAVAAQAQTLSTTKDTLRTSGTHEYVPELGGYLDKRYLPFVKQYTNSDTVFIEEYAGLLTALNRPPQTVRVDSVIHALGSERTRMETAITAEPDLVITTSPDLSHWSIWNVSANWWFFRHLFRNYIPQKSSPTTLSWTRSDQPTVEWETLPCTVNNDAGLISMDVTTPGLYEVTLRYQGPGRDSRSFTMVRTAMNPAAGARGYLPLDPGADLQRFPLYVQTPGRITLDTRDTPTGTEPVTRLLSCETRTVHTPPDADTVTLYEPYFLRQRGWKFDPKWTPWVAPSPKAIEVARRSGKPTPPVLIIQEPEDTSDPARR